MRDKPSLQDLLEVQRYFRLPSAALVEKDWYVVRALAAITSADVAPFRLVFSGGTALARAHRLIRRMSEDIDLKIITDETPTRSAYRRLRERITEALHGVGFAFDPANPQHLESGNGSRYMLYRLPYSPITAGEAALRPEIQIEAAVWPLRRSSIERAVTSFVAEAFKRPIEAPAVECVSIVETAAEKFVALTRRAGAELAAAGGPRDPTLVRHIYDLHVIREHYDPAEVTALARDIMLGDAKAYGHQFPAYRDNPIAETLKAVAGLASDPDFANRYAQFRRDMVYGELVEFDEAMAAVIAIAGSLGETESERK